MTTIRILFLGASRLVGLLERFKAASVLLNVKLEMFSFEDGCPWHAIGVSGLATLSSAPSFVSDEFTEHLLDFTKVHGIDIVISNIDKATIALARARPALQEAGILPLVSSVLVCETMADKRRADALFRQLELKVPVHNEFPLLAKPRFGASSRGIVTFKDSDELEFWKQRNNTDDYMFQKFIMGKEYSMDGYVGREGRLLGIVSRTRIVVSGGEVMITQTERNDRALALAERLIAWDNWYGPFTVQAIDDGKEAWLIECNPRFGSGATCSIEAGLLMPEWIIRERLGLSLPDKPIKWRDGLCMTRARKDYFLWLS